VLHHESIVDGLGARLVFAIRRLPLEEPNGMLSVVVADLAELVQDPAFLGLGAIFIAQTYGRKLLSSSLGSHSDSFR
jgi:hypothetical protein